MNAVLHHLRAIDAKLDRLLARLDAIEQAEFERELARSVVEDPIVCPTSLVEDKLFKPAREYVEGDIALPFDERPKDARTVEELLAALKDLHSAAIRFRNAAYDAEPTLVVRNEAVDALSASLLLAERLMGK